MFKIKECKKQALASLKGKWKAPVLGQLIYLALTLVAFAPYMIIYFNILRQTSNIVYYDSYSPVTVMLLGVGMLFSLILYMGYIVCILPALMMGMMKLSAKVANNVEDLSCKEVFSGFKMYGKSLGSFWWVYLWTMLWMMTLYVPIIITMSISTAALLSNNAILALIMSILDFVAIIGLYWLIIYKSIRYSMIWYVLADDKSVPVIQAMNISKQITKGHTLKLFLLNLSFIGWEILGILSLGVGLLWVGPYSQVSHYNAYRVLRDAAFPKNEEIAAPQITE